MAPSATHHSGAANGPSLKTTREGWSSGFNTLKREKLFRAPPSDKTAYPQLAEAFKPHIDSFNAVFAPDGYLEHGIRDIGTKTFLDGDSRDGTPLEERNRLNVRVTGFTLDRCVIPQSNRLSWEKATHKIYPAECRERHASYKGKLQVTLQTQINDGEWTTHQRDLGQLPLMVRSNKCHLEALSPAAMVDRKEEAEEFGGYFIVNGLEKLIRLLIVPRRNYPLAIVRPSFKKRGATYTEFGISIRSVRPDQSSITNVLHFLNDGNAIFRFSWRKNEFLVPVMMILKALVETNDREIFQGLVDTLSESALREKQLVIDRVESLLSTHKVYGMQGKAKHRSYLGNRFRPALQMPETVTDEEAGTYFLRKIVLPHLGSYDVTEEQDADKFNMLLFMLKKLYALVEGECARDNEDAVSNQEILLGGFLYGQIVKERIEEWIGTIRLSLITYLREFKGREFTNPAFTRDFVPKILRKTNENIGATLEYFMSTGNLTSASGLDLQQANGFTIVAEKLNFYRFLSHFRMIHRGSFFAQLKTTTVRKLLPESWGFLCPVHTPDGGPCGLLNHLAHKCIVATSGLDVSAVPGIVSQMGVSRRPHDLSGQAMVVQLDGRILGYCLADASYKIADALRFMKVKGSREIPRELEIGHVPTSKGGQYPGIYMFSHPQRMYRPVKHLGLGQLDYVGPFEQPHMSIAVTEPEVKPGEFTHVEFHPTNILSVVANMTPYSDFNQSPRNMYQCQMGKQTMGTPGTALRYRADNKVYKLQTGQTPVVRPPLHNEYALDSFPNGTNAVVAVISYTGYDMDDAMILNKSSHERGFGYGAIYKTKVIRLDETKKARSNKSIESAFGFAPGGLVKSEWRVALDDDGLPHVGRLVREGDLICASHAVDWDPGLKQHVNRDGETHMHRYQDAEEAFVEEVRLHGAEDGTMPAGSVSIKFRVPRSPVIGDKFSSRHGQKGVCSQKWPSIDMPFSESGMQPDVIINPHAFPSRMTIGMFVESLAGKSGALHGIAQDATPWQFEDRPGNTAVEYFGHQLREAGYNYYGNEPMYSGTTGTELAADIYLGVVYYQRLRHMVNDKFQVRTTGPVTATTGQPVKGRSRGGGIRVGEMERDALIAHGTAFLLQDRLMNCSDYTKAWICKRCGSFLSTTPTVGGFGAGRRGTGMVRCRRCAKATKEGEVSRSGSWEDGQGTRFKGGDETTVVAVPGVLRYLDVELAAAGVRLKFTVTP